MYIAIIGDIINSKLLENRAAVQEQLRDVLFEINKTYKKDIVSQFTITVGDEFQAILKLSAQWLYILEKISQEMRPVQVRFGIGVGTIVTTINKKQSIGADGPAYWLAREAINYIHEKNDYGINFLAIRTGDVELDRTVNVLLATTAYIKSTWTASQEKFFAALLDQQIYTEKFEQKTIANTLHLSESAFTKRLKNSGLKIYFRAKEEILRQIVAYEKEGDE